MSVCSRVRPLKTLVTRGLGQLIRKLGLTVRMPGVGTASKLLPEGLPRGCKPGFCTRCLYVLVIFAVNPRGCA